MVAPPAQVLITAAVGEPTLTITGLLQAMPVTTVSVHVVDTSPAESNLIAPQALES